MRRQHGHRPEAIPVRRSVREGHEREGDMSDHLPIEFRDQRFRQRSGGTQRLDDELLGVLADSEGLEGGDGDGGDGVGVGVGSGLAMDEDVAVHLAWILAVAQMGKGLRSVDIMPPSSIL